MSWVEGSINPINVINALCSDLLMLEKPSEKKDKKIFYTEDGIPVRKLYFTMSAKKASKRRIENHFKVFGEIENFQFYRRGTHCYGFVLYRSLECAATALKSKPLVIGRQKLKILAADSWHQPSETEVDRLDSDLSADTHQMPSSSGSHNNKEKSDIVQNENDIFSINLSHLNDDCLIEIFQYLNIIDLCALDSTCIRFHQIAQNIFTKNHRFVNFNRIKGKYSDSYVPNLMKILGSLETQANSGDLLTLHESRNLLIHFGQLINRIFIDSDSFKAKNPDRVVDFIARYCPNLETLEIRNFYLKDSAVVHYKPLFNNLNELAIHSCQMKNGYNQIFENCTKLTKLNITSESYLNGSSLVMPFRKLESVSLISNSNISSDDLYKFFELNKKLKHLTIINCGYIYDEIFERIGSLLLELESLTIYVDDFVNLADNLKHLLKLNKLKELKLNCSLYSIASFVRQLADKGIIEVLHISGGVLDEHLIEALCACKSLRSLKLCSMPNVHDRFLIELAKSLPELVDFHLSRCQTMTCDGILKFVDTAKKLHTLNISNSTIKIEEYFYIGLVNIFRERPITLTLNMARCVFYLPEELTEEHKRYVTVFKLPRFVNDEDECWFRNETDDEDDDIDPFEIDGYDFDDDSSSRYESDEDNLYNDFREYENFAYCGGSFFLD